MNDKYTTTNPEALKHEMREYTDSQLRSIYSKNDPWSTLRAIHGDASRARHVAACREIHNRKWKKCLAKAGR